MSRLLLALRYSPPRTLLGDVRMVLYPGSKPPSCEAPALAFPLCELLCVAPPEFSSGLDGATVIRMDMRGTARSSGTVGFFRLFRGSGRVMAQGEAAALQFSSPHLVAGNEIRYALEMSVTGA